MNKKKHLGNLDLLEKKPTATVTVPGWRWRLSGFFFSLAVFLFCQASTLKKLINPSSELLFVWVLKKISWKNMNRPFF